MELQDLKGLGPTRLAALRAMSICSLRDLLFTLPISYRDGTQLAPCAVASGETAVKGVLKAAPKLSRFHGLTKVSATLQDASGVLPLTWYNQPWVCQQYQGGEEMLFWGRVTVKNGRRAMVNPQRMEEGQILPVYRAIPGLPGKTLRRVMTLALEQVEDCCPETLPQGLRLRHGLCEMNFAIRQAHFPSCMENLRMARRRLAFERMLLYQAGISLMRQRGEKGFPMPLEEGASARYWQTLPFPPSHAQQRVLQEIFQDLRRERPMSRLVQGDVGCGKTALAFGALWAVAQCGYQGALMAPTEILARQHWESAQKTLAPLGIRCGLLLGGMRAAERRKALTAIANGEWQVVIGTHALLSEGVKYHRLGLVVTDEQHRFGVRQRSQLQHKGESDGVFPHVLVMSATPIPRTLALILYGDLDVSVVDELPPGRTPVSTRIVPEEKRADMYGFVRKEVAMGRQAYIVCPLVEDSEALEEVKSATAQYHALTTGPLSGLRVGLTYGKQPGEEKERTLEAFAQGNLDVLVSTTVIEVGVNVPNATLMIIENPDRYGLSQLHQLRGRVGRGSAASWCFLVAEPNERLRTLTQTNDGFLIAKKDLELRGPGDMFGTRQHGEATLGILLDGDVRLLEETSRCLRELRGNPDLSAEWTQVEEQARTFFHGRLREIALN